jgi:hypothetical protein
MVTYFDELVYIWQAQRINDKLESALHSGILPLNERIMITNS